MGSSAGVFLVIVADVERPVTDQPAFRVTLAPNPAVAKQYALRYVVSKQTDDKWIREGPARNCLELAAAEANRVRGQWDWGALCHIRSGRQIEQTTVFPACRIVSSVEDPLVANLPGVLARMRFDGGLPLLH